MAVVAQPVIDAVVPLGAELTGTEALVSGREDGVFPPGATRLRVGRRRKTDGLGSWRDGGCAKRKAANGEENNKTTLHERPP